MTWTGPVCAAIATALYLSYIPGWLVKREPLARLGLPPRWTGGGLVGTAVGLALLPLIPASGPAAVVFIVAAVLGACWVCGRADRHLGSHDDPRIVLDEVVGFWAAAALLPRDAWTMLGAFVLFRLMDVAKLPPLKRLEALPGGFGVVMDDVAAGVYANLLLRALRAALLSASFLFLLSPAWAQTTLTGFAVDAGSTPVLSTSPYQGIPLSSDRGPWVIGEVRFTGQQALSEFALSTRVRARRGVLYTPSDVAGDIRELQSVPGVLSARSDLFAIPGQPAPENYASIAVSSMMVRLVYTVEEKPLYLPGLTAPTTTQAQAAASKEAQVPPASVSGIVLTPTAYRGLGRNNRPGLGLDVNLAYFIGRLYGKNSLPYTTRKTNYIDRIGVWFLSFDGKMQLQSEGVWRPAMTVGTQGTFSFRDAPQPQLQTVSVTVNPAAQGTKTMAGAYAVATKNLKGVRTSVGFMQGNAGDSVGLLSEYLTDQALAFSGHPGSQAKSNSTFFASLLYLPTPTYPLAVEYLKPNGMPLDPWMLNFKLGHFLKLNFDLAFLKFNGGWDVLGTFQFRYTQFPKKG
ncbi:MAG TPA: hypothetical protein DCM05_14925 [Elusimicrobia bacterium]|nr:hypothetical protein [Elusimicrobiota bacterium]